MKTKHQYLFIALALSASLHKAAAQGTEFTYQGRLTSGTNAANGSYDMEFSVFDSLAFGNPVGNINRHYGTAVSNGLFTVVLGFGQNVFTGDARWLSISVRTNDGGAFTALTPLQPLTPTPYAIMAGNAANLGGQTSTAFVAKAGDTMTGTLNLPAPAILAFGAGTRQMISLYDNPPYNFGIGVQTATLYQRTDIGGGFAWYGGGVHSDGQNNPGGGALLMTLDSGGNLAVNSGVSGSAISLDGSGIAVHGVGSKFGTFGTAGRGVVGESYNNVGVFGESATSEGVHGKSTSGWGVYGHSQGNDGVFGQTFANAQSGVLGRNDGPSGVGGRAVFGYARTGAIGVNGVSETGDGVVGESHGAAKTGVVGLSSSSTGYGGYFYNTGGGVALHVNGSAEVLCLTILGGCDVAEPFQMSAKEIPKGAVVVIDDENAGQLKLSDHAYDSRVAGIVSGANGINSGISLHQEGVIEGGQNVALSGRVYVLADASSSPIKPGDLLTTSSIPGHAMKVTDRDKAQGAIIGKAMSALKDGKGMVLVLVTLQ